VGLSEKCKKSEKLKDFFQQNSESIIYTQTSSSKRNQKRETKKEKPK
jgi:hypothetical protein